MLTIKHSIASKDELLSIINIYKEMYKISSRARYREDISYVSKECTEEEITEKNDGIFLSVKMVNIR